GSVSRAASPHPAMPSPPCSQATVAGAGSRARRSPGSEIRTVATASWSGEGRPASGCWAPTADHSSSACYAPVTRARRRPKGGPGGTPVTCVSADTGGHEGTAGADPALAGRPAGVRSHPYLDYYDWNYRMSLAARPSLAPARPAWLGRLVSRVAAD